MCIDEFNGDNFDHGPLGFVGGGYIGQVQTNGRPIETTPVPPGTPAWGVGVETGGARQLPQHGLLRRRRARFVVRLPDNYLDLDPTYKDRFGRPLLRMTMDLHENELKMSAYLTDRYAEIIERMGAKQVVKRPRTGPYDITAYQTSHLCGGAIMGDEPRQQRAQQLFAELGRAEPVRAGCDRVSPKSRLQPDWHRRGARFLECRRDPLAISQKPGAARPCVVRTPSPQLPCSASLR